MNPAPTPVFAALKRLAAVVAQVMAASRDAEMHAVAVAEDRVHAETAVARMPFACVLVIADPRDHLPRVAAIAAPERARPAPLPHHNSLRPLPGSIDQMLASARPSSFGKAGADFVSLKVLPRSVERRPSCRNRRCSSTRRSAVCRACRRAPSRRPRPGHTDRAERTVAALWAIRRRTILFWCRCRE